MLHSPLIDPMNHGGGDMHHGGGNMHHGGDNMHHGGGNMHHGGSYIGSVSTNWTEVTILLVTL